MNYWLDRKKNYWLDRKKACEKRWKRTELHSMGPACEKQRNCTEIHFSLGTDYALKRPEGWDIEGDYEFLRSNLLHNTENLVSLDVKFARMIERWQKHIQDGRWHWVEEYLMSKLHMTQTYCENLRHFVAKISLTEWKEMLS